MPNQTANPTVAGSESASHLDGARILFVDDDAAYRGAVLRAIGASNFTLVTASSGEEALTRLAAEDFDIICTDQHMPGMRGSDLLAIVKARYPAVSRIIISGFAELDVVLRVVNEIGIFRFLTKPCHAVDLQAAFEQAMRAKRGESVELPRPSNGSRDASARFKSGLDSLWLAAQPIVDTRSWSTFGYELLLRTRDLSIESPPAFFGLAASVHGVRRLERAIRGAAAGIAARLPAGASLFLNIECESLGDETLYDADAPLSAHASSVVLELTERSRLDVVPNVPDRIKRLREMGYRIAVDDLGAGYAGLNSIAELGPDIVKFDYSLVHEVHASPVRQRLLRTMLELCQELQITAVAEGVETPQELAEMVALGCPLLQGYYFARPGTPFPVPVVPASVHEI